MSETLDYSEAMEALAAIYNPLFDVSTRYVGSERCDVDDCQCTCHSEGSEEEGRKA